MSSNTKINYELIAGVISSHFSETMFSYDRMRKTFDYENIPFATPFELHGEQRKVAGMFEMNCYFGEIPCKEEFYAAYICDSAYDGKGQFSPLEPLTSRTMCLIAEAAERSDEDSIADIMIAAICHEAMYEVRNNTFYQDAKFADIARSRLLFLIKAAEKNLSAKKYKLWTGTRGHYYVYDLDADDVSILLREICVLPDEERIGSVIFNAFSHLIEDCTFEIINTNDFISRLFHYENNICNALCDGAIPSLNLVKTYRKFEREKYNIPASNGDNLPAIVDKRIDACIHRFFPSYV